MHKPKFKPEIRITKKFLWLSQPLLINTPKSRTLNHWRSKHIRCHFSFLRKQGHAKFGNRQQNPEDGKHKGTEKERCKIAIHQSFSGNSSNRLRASEILLIFYSTKAIFSPEILSKHRKLQSNRHPKQTYFQFMNNSTENLLLATNVKIKIQNRLWKLE